MTIISEFILKKLSSPNFNKNATEWAEILEDKNELQPERLENALKETPAYNFLEIVNFAQYFKELEEKEIENKTIEDIFMDWEMKIRC